MNLHGKDRTGTGNNWIPQTTCAHNNGKNHANVAISWPASTGFDTHTQGG